MKPLHHHLVATKINKIKPTQGAVGFYEVEQKRLEWSELSKKEKKARLENQWFPSVIGPDQQYFIIDHHHLGLALHKEGQEDILLTVLKDFSHLEKDDFWKIMEFYRFVHPFDKAGNRINYDKIPTKIIQLEDDPFRSLAGQLRNTGVFSKTDQPFAEFAWADFLRNRLSSEKQVDKAKKIAESEEASHLPGWIYRRPKT